MLLPKALIFDMDGLMLDSEPLYQEAWQAAASELGYEIDAELYMSLIGRSSAEADQMFLRIFGKAFPVSAFNQRWDALWRMSLDRKGVALKPGLLPLLDWVGHSKIPSAVGTSSNLQEAERCLSLAGIRDRFSTLVTVDQVAEGKPAPDIFLAVASRLGVEPQQCLVLEDSNAGVEAAQAAAMSVVMVPDLQVPTEISKAIALQILPSLYEVLAWLQGL